MFKTYPKSRAARITIRDLREKVKGDSNVVWDGNVVFVKILKETIRSIRCTRISSPAVMMDLYRSPKTNTLTDWLIDKKSSMLDGIACKPGCKEKDNDQ